MAGTRETEVGLDGWCEGGLGQQRSDGGGGASLRERSESVESPGTYELNEFHAAIFALLIVLSDCPPVLWWLSPGEGGMPLHNAVVINCKNGATFENQGVGVKYIG